MPAGSMAHVVPHPPRIPGHSKIKLRYGNVRHLAVLVPLIGGRPLPCIAGEDAGVKRGVVLFFDGFAELVGVVEDFKFNLSINTQTLHNWIDNLIY